MAPEATVAQKMKFFMIRSPQCSGMRPFAFPPVRQRAVDYAMRKILLRTIAGLASLASSAWGAFAWARGDAGQPHSPLFLFACLFPVLSIVAFTVFLRWPLPGLAFAWLLMSAGFGTTFLLNLVKCAGGACTQPNAVKVAGETLMSAPHLWLLAVAAICLLLHYTSPASQGAPNFPTPPDRQSPE